MFSTSSSRRKSNISRTSTMDTRVSGSLVDENRQLSRMSSSPSEVRSETQGSPRKPPYVGTEIDMGQSEIDLNERLNLARKNSRTMAMLSPASSRLAAKSVSELRSQMEERQEERQGRTSKLAAKSVADLRRRDDPFTSPEPALPLAEACKSDRYPFAAADDSPDSVSDSYAPSVTHGTTSDPQQDAFSHSWIEPGHSERLATTNRDTSQSSYDPKYRRRDRLAKHSQNGRTSCI